LYYVTTGKWIKDLVLDARRAAGEADLKATGQFRGVEFTCIGADGIQKLYSQTRNALAREFIFTDRAVVPEIPGVSEAYLGFVSAPTFLSLVTDENTGEIIKSIFYDNVRDWQDYNKVNSEMKETIESNKKSRFVLMNNGVTIIARTVRPTGNRFYIEDYQVVNGCQTSHVLAGSRDIIDDSIMVPLRLIGTQDENVISDIVHATNRQTEVKDEQFFAVTEFAKKVELFFQSFADTKKLYYERRSHQFDALPIEKTRIVTPGSLIKAFAAMYREEPHSTTRNYGRLIDQIGKSIFLDEHKLDPYYVSAFAAYKLEYLFRSQAIDASLKPARYQILLAFRLIANAAPLPRMNANEMERHCRVICDILWDSSKCFTYFRHAADAVSTVAAGNFDSDNIRVLPFTERVLSYCKTLGPVKLPTVDEIF